MVGIRFILFFIFFDKNEAFGGYCKPNETPFENDNYLLIKSLCYGNCLSSDGYSLIIIDTFSIKL
ncbi:hypothetical protein yfred0001_31350 [Yersinia frederiksenii ATCC 33641]|nr:hypothetical protein yfred0001_31350 [Yersinia frederiksenii ATCC 33641]